MQTTLDYNTHALNEFHYQQDNADKEWELSKPESCDEAVKFAYRLMSVDDRSTTEFQWSFTDFYDGVNWSVEDFEETLDNWILGIAPATIIEAECLWAIGIAALEAASQILFNVELDELSTFSQGERNTKRMVRELLAMGGSNDY